MGAPTLDLIRVDRAPGAWALDVSFLHPPQGWRIVIPAEASPQQVALVLRALADAIERGGK